MLYQNVPALPLTQEQMDAAYDLPYTRKWHPSYDDKGGVPALSEVQFSLVSQRGCLVVAHLCYYQSSRPYNSKSQPSVFD